MELDRDQLIEMTQQSLEAYIDAGWEEADADELADELASFLEGTEAETLAISPLQYKFAVRRMLERLWSEVRAQLPDDPKDVAAAEKALLLFIIEHLDDVIRTFAAFFQGQVPQPNELAPIVAVLILYFLRRWEDHLQVQRRLAF